jgi:predicted nucleic acid-binding protein
LWKNRNKIKNPSELAHYFYYILKNFNVINDLPIDEILRISIEKNISFYSASYLYASQEYNLILVSDNEELLKFDNVINSEEFI